MAGRKCDLKPVSKTEIRRLLNRIENDLPETAETLPVSRASSRRCVNPESETTEFSSQFATTKSSYYESDTGRMPARRASRIGQSMPSWQLWTADRLKAAD